MGIRHTKATDEHGHGYYPTQTWDSGAVLAVREFTCEDQAGDRPETRWTSAVYGK